MPLESQSQELELSIEKDCLRWSRARACWCGHSLVELEKEKEEERSWEDERKKRKQRRSLDIILPKINWESEVGWEKWWWVFLHFIWKWFTLTLPYSSSLWKTFWKFPTQMGTREDFLVKISHYKKTTMLHSSFDINKNNFFS